MREVEFEDEHREFIYENALAEMNNLIWTMRRYYFASKVLGLFATLSEWVTLIFAGVLFSGSRLSGVDSSITAGLSISIGVVALLKAYHHPQKDSETYYRRGQEFQELFEEFRYFIDLEAKARDASNEQLQDELRHLSQQRHELNQAAPQLNGVWYWILKRKPEWVYGPVDMTEEERKHLEEL